MDFDSNFFSGNRQKLLSASKAGLIVLTANGLLQRSADTTFSFRQDSNFWYLTGIDEPDYILVLTAEEQFLIAPERSEHRDLWDGPIDQTKIVNGSGLQTILDSIEGWNRLDRLIKYHKKVHTITPAESYFASFGFYANPARKNLIDQISKHRHIELVDIRKVLARQRQIKQPVEIAAIKKAINITAKTLSLVTNNFSKYGFEYELEADITAGLIRHGANGHAYQPIIAAGKNAATIHYTSNRSKLEDGQLILFDVGAEYKNYSADISRTYIFGRPSQRQRAVYAAVKSVQHEALKLLRPGVKLRAYEKQVDTLMAQQLKKLKLIDDEKNTKALKKYYPHLASHFLGLDTHDAADYDMPLKPGMVLTVEPGIYIADESIGVRLEDDVLITKDGNELLSDSLPKSL